MACEERGEIGRRKQGTRYKADLAAKREEREKKENSYYQKKYKRESKLKKALV